MIIIVDQSIETIWINYNQMGKESFSIFFSSFFFLFVNYLAYLWTTCHLLSTIEQLLLLHSSIISRYIVFPNLNFYSLFKIITHHDLFQFSNNKQVLDLT